MGEKQWNVANKNKTEKNPMGIYTYTLTSEPYLPALIGGVA